MRIAFYQKIRAAISNRLCQNRDYSMKAQLFASKKQYAKTIAIYDRMIHQQPEAYTYNNRGNAKSYLGQKQAAIIDYDRAISLNPKLINAYYNRGNVKSELGEDRAALIDYDRAIALNPKPTNAYYHRGNIRSDLGDKNGAIADLTTAAELFRQQAQMDSYRAAIDLLAKIKK
jgi:tetratricopeptide (TPR) repeat protein